MKYWFVGFGAVIEPSIECSRFVYLIYYEHELNLSLSLS
jgi:hypothetical protein